MGTDDISPTCICHLPLHQIWATHSGQTGQERRYKGAGVTVLVSSVGSTGHCTAREDSYLIDELIRTVFVEQPLDLLVTLQIDGLTLQNHLVLKYDRIRV